jgi:hypothetical protein
MLPKFRCLTYRVEKVSTRTPLTQACPFFAHPLLGQYALQCQIIESHKIMPTRIQPGAAEPQYC